MSRKKKKPRKMNEINLVFHREEKKKKSKDFLCCWILCCFSCQKTYKVQKNKKKVNQKGGVADEFKEMFHVTTAACCCLISNYNSFTSILSFIFTIYCRVVGWNDIIEISVGLSEVKQWIEMLDNLMTYSQNWILL